MKNKIPGLSSTLPARQNIFGEDVLYPRSVGPALISPFIYSQKPALNSKGVPETIEAKDDLALRRELFRLGYDGPIIKEKGLKGETLEKITMPTHTIDDHGASIELDPRQYSEYVKLGAGIGLEPRFNPFKDQTLKQTLSELVKTNFEGVIPPSRMRDETKREVIRKVITAYRKGAKAQFLMFNEKAYTAMTDAQKWRETARTNNDISAGSPR